MSKLTLVLVVDRHDHVIDIVRGAVTAPGIEFNAFELPLEEMMQRFVRWQEWDVSEFSMGNYVAQLSSGDTTLVGLPAFPSRVFRHSAFYVRQGGDISDPSDLAGRRVGVPEWAQTAGIYARGLLTHEWGVDLSEISWVQAGLNEPGREEHVPLHLPSGVEIEVLPSDTLDALLLSGKLDALISARPPNSFLLSSGTVTRLIRDSVSVEREYYRRTGIFPIMHLVVLRRDVFERNPWAALNVLEAFEEARGRSLARLRDSASSAVLLPWHAPDVEDLIASRGGAPGEYWPYGVERNRLVLETFLTYCHEQGVTSRLLSLEELFPSVFFQNVRT